MKIRNVIKEALDSTFINSSEVAEVISLGYQAQKNVLLWGPPGYGKSQMVQLALEEVAREELLDPERDVFVQSFGEGMTEGRLWGGVDLKALETDHVVRYFPENSFLAKPLVIFEELLDAPPVVLLSLKDTLTARELRNGSQRYKMKTRFIVAVTNKEPAELSEMGPEYKAVIERFPIQYNVKWGKHDEASYLMLFDKVCPSAPEWVGRDLSNLFAVREEGVEPISPRTAVHALECVLAQWKALGGDSGGDDAKMRALECVRYVAGIDSSNLDERFERMKERMVVRKCRKAVSSYSSRFYDLERKFERMSTMKVSIEERLKRYSELKRTVEEVLEEYGTLQVHDDVFEEYRKLRESFERLIAEVKKAIMEVVEGL